MLRPSEPAAFEIVNAEGRAPIVLICDHASHRIPEALGDLGVSKADRLTHIGWDIGAESVARVLSRALDAPLVVAGYSRLVIDLNRPPSVPSAFPTTSGGIEIPGNRGLTEADRSARYEALFQPYHSTIARMLEERRALRDGAGPILISVHSFTPSLLGQARPWPIAMLYGEDTRLAHRFLAALAALSVGPVGDNEPYRVTRESDYALPVHGLDRGLLHTAFEIRQDGIDTPAGAERWANVILRAFSSFAREVGVELRL
jgi:predicted N-formylglutamate amidohydrolase